jgi:hypothetical protein
VYLLAISKTPIALYIIIHKTQTSALTQIKPPIQNGGDRMDDTMAARMAKKTASHASASSEGYGVHPTAPGARQRARFS